MKRLPAVAFLLASCVVPPRFPRDTAIPRMEADVQFLASDELKGRNNATPEGAKAAEYVARQMEAAGLRPAGENGTWFQSLPKERGRNVIGAIRGLTDRWIVIGAHHDGLGVRRDKIHNGADDNASGVAVILEVARRLARPLQHGILFCSFDAEEDGLVGSNFFVRSGLFPASSFAAMICLDLVGGSFLPGDERRVFALGSESSPELFEWIGRERTNRDALEVERIGIYAIEPMGPMMARSDYSAFRSKEVPFVFLSTGTPWYYHTPEDDVARLDFSKMERVVDLVERLATDLTVSPPEWRTPASDKAEDARLMADACRRVLEHPAIRATDAQRGEIAEVLQDLSEGGSGATSSVQKAMMLLFRIAAAQRPAH